MSAYASLAPRPAQRLLGQTAKACREFNLISPGDRLTLGLSGGKDSLALLWTLAVLRGFYPVAFDLAAVTLTAGFPGEDASVDYAAVAALCGELAVPYRIIPTVIAQVAFGEQNRDSPCGLCARLRRAALVQAAKEDDRGTLVLAHHQDDAIETYLMSILFEGRINCFSPATYYEDSAVRVIRPFVFLEEAEIARFVRRAGLPVVTNRCPVDGSGGQGGRARVKALIADLRRDKRDIKATLFHALRASGLAGWGKY